MASSTRGQIAVQYARLKKSVTLVQRTNDFGKQLSDSALYLLDIFPLSGSTEGPSQTLPDAEDVQGTPRSLMRVPEQILTEELIKAPLFPISLVRDVAKLFNFGNLQEITIKSLELNDLDKRNKSLMAHLWFLEFLNCDVETMKAALALFRHTRGSPNLLQRTQDAEIFLENVLNVKEERSRAPQTDYTLLNTAS